MTQPGLWPVGPGPGRCLAEAHRASVPGATGPAWAVARGTGKIQVHSLSPPRRPPPGRAAVTESARPTRSQSESGLSPGNARARAARGSEALALGGHWQHLAGDHHGMPGPGSGRPRRPGGGRRLAAAAVTVTESAGGSING